MISETSWSLRALALLLVVAAISALPTSDPSADVVIDPIIVDDTTLSTELKPPPIPEKEHQYVLFVINLFAVKNSSGESAEEIFENEVVEKVPSLLGPLATVFLLVEVDGNDTETNEPVNLDEVATDLEDVEGFKVEKIKENGETKLLKVNLDQNDIDGMMPSKSKLEKMTKVRNKRSPCLKCKLKGFHGGGGGYGGGGGGGYGGGGGGGFGGGLGGGSGLSGGGYNKGGCGGGGCGGGGYPGGGGGYPGGGGYYPGGGGGCGGGGCGGGYPSGGGGYPGGGGGGYPGGGGGGYPGGGGGGYPSGEGGYPSGGGCGEGGCTGGYGHPSGGSHHHGGYQQKGY